MSLHRPQSAAGPLENQGYGRRTQIGRWLRQQEDPQALVEWCQEWNHQDIWAWAARVSPAALKEQGLRVFLQRGGDVLEEILRNNHLDQQGVNKIVKLLAEEKITDAFSANIYSHLEALQAAGWELPSSTRQNIWEQIQQKPGEINGRAWIVMFGEPDLSADTLTTMWKKLKDRKQGRDPGPGPDEQWFSWAEARMVALHPGANEAVYQTLLKTAREYGVGAGMVCGLFYSQEKIRRQPRFWDWVCQEVNDEYIGQMLDQAPRQYLSRLIEKLIKFKAPDSVGRVIQQLHQKDLDNEVERPFLERLGPEEFEKLLMIEDREVRQTLFRHLQRIRSESSESLGQRGR